MTTLRGVLPVLHMPYNEDWTIDFDVLAAEVEFALSEDANGIVFALASELLRLTGAERRTVAEFLVRAAAGRVPVIVSVGAESTYAAVENARHAESVGASALMATPPLATRAGEPELADYYGALVDATTLPVIVQDASSYVGAPLSVGFQAALYAAHGERIAFKPEASPVGPVITALNATSGGTSRIYEGSGGAMLAENFRRGVAGTMPGTDLLDAIVALWWALEAGDEEKIYALSPLIGAIQALGVGLDGYLVIEKHLLKRRGLFKNTLVRGPVAFHLDPPAEAEVDRLYDMLVEQL
ncbi:MAG TPA: dihydrodipicolinate synthase family protein [Chthonomonadaceae bacterium]|nr:dihydrodipicolinate synthase family protein [Chthonomonadaceae bacterium]